MFCHVSFTHSQTVVSDAALIFPAGVKVFSMYPSCLCSVTHFATSSSRASQWHFFPRSAHFLRGIDCSLSTFRLQSRTSFSLTPNSRPAFELLDFSANCTTLSLNCAVYLWRLLLVEDIVQMPWKCQFSFQFWLLYVCRDQKQTSDRQPKMRTPEETFRSKIDWPMTIELLHHARD